MMYARVCAFPVVFFLLFFLFGSGCTEKKKAFQCDDELGCVTLLPDDPLKLGVLQALSGKVASLGTDQLRGLELALDEVRGQVLGHRVVLHVEDTGCTPEGGANSVLKIIADPDSVAIFGTTCSGAARTASQAMSRAGLLMISGNNSAPFLTSMNKEKAPYWQDGYFRVAKNEEYAGSAAAKYAFNELHVKKAAVIHDGDIYTRGLAEGFVRAFTKLGGEVTLTAVIAKGESQMAPVLTAVEQSGAHLLFFPLFQPEGNLIVHQAKSRPGMKNMILMSDGALIVQSFIDDVKDLGVGMYFVGPTKAEGPRVKELARRYEEKYKAPPVTGYYINGYDAARLLFDAIAKTAVREEDGTVYIKRKALRQSMYAMKDVQGVTGILSCNEFGDCAKPSFSVLRFDNPDMGLKGLQDNQMKGYVFE